MIPIPACIVRVWRCVSTWICAAAISNAAWSQGVQISRLDNGLLQLESVHLQLLTDLPTSAEIESLPVLFDQAVPQWCDRFKIDRQAVIAAKATAYLMGDRSRFVQLG